MRLTWLKLHGSNAIAATLTLHAHTWSSLARTPDMREYSYLHDETTTFNTDFPHRQGEKSPFQQHAVSYTPESDLLDWGFRMAQGSSLLTR